MATPKKKTKPKRRYSRMVFLGLLFVSFWLLVGVGKEVYTTFRLRSQYIDATQKLAKVKAENEQLIDQKQKLQDPDYVESYARNNYNLSKEGEQIFYLPEDPDK